MVYDVVFTIETKKRLSKYNREIQDHFFKKIDKLRYSPKLYGKPLRNVFSGTWELYFEHRYRILYSIDDDKKLVTIETILHKDEF